MRLRLLWRITRMDVMTTLEYRGAFFIYMVNIVATPLISLLVWLTVAEQGVHLPYGRDQFVTYYVLLSLTSMLTSVWLAPFLADQIRLGQISPLLLHPAPVITNYIGNNLGEKIIKLPLVLPLLGLMALGFHQYLRLPSSPGLWLAFAAALPLAATLAFLLDYLLGSLAFWVQDVSGLIRFKTLAAALLSGQLVPLAFFPTPLAPFLQAQPFRYTLSFPLEILVGHLGRAALLTGFAWMLAYCLILVAGYRLIWHVGLRSYSSSGA